MENLTLKELKNLAKDLNIKGFSKMRKQELIDILQNTQKSSFSSDASKMKMIDLFAGTGGFSLAFESTNKVEVVFANDFDKNSKQIYDLNFSHKLTLKDINEIETSEIPSHDILTAGFPCQPFSIAGLRKGFEDDRSNVFWKILDIVAYHKPRFLVLENVKNLLSHDEGKTFEIIKSNIQDLGYYLIYNVLDTSEITGIPQHRERIYITCFREKDDFEKFSLDFPKLPKKSFQDMLEKSKVEQKYYYTEDSAIWNLLSENVTSTESIYQYRRVYVRENKNKECPTLTANMGTGGHNVPIIRDEFGIRKFTPRECFNFQGFPQSYNLGKLSNTSLYKLCGNAVSYPVVKLIADRLVDIID